VATDYDLPTAPLLPLPPSSAWRLVRKAYIVVAMRRVPDPKGGYSDGVPRGWVQICILRPLHGGSGLLEWRTQDGPDWASLQAAVDREYALLATPLAVPACCRLNRIKVILDCPRSPDGAVNFRWSPWTC
jgi:hypothetical protein